MFDKSIVFLEMFSTFVEQKYNKMSEQKFKRGNLVKVLTGHNIWSFEGGSHTTEDIRPEDIGREAIIDYSYAEKYGGTDVDNYSIVFRDTGTSLAWKRTDELEFIDEGGEHLFEEARINNENYQKSVYTEFLKSKKQKRDPDVLSNFSEDFIKEFFYTDPTSYYVLNSIIRDNKPYKMIEYLLKERKRFEEISTSLIKNFSTQGSWKPIQDQIQEINQKYDKNK